MQTCSPAAVSSPKGHRRSLIVSAPAPLLNRCAGSTRSTMPPTPATLRTDAVEAPAIHRVETTSVMSTRKSLSASAIREGTKQSSPGARSPAMAPSRISAFVLVHPRTAASQSGRGTKKSSRRKLTHKKKEAARSYKLAPLTVTHVGALTSSHASPNPSPVPSPGASRSPCVLSSPSATEKARRIRDNCTSSLLPSSSATSVPCALYDLHHALQHRLVEDFGWSLHWYLDTETEIKQLEVLSELDEKAKHPSHKINGKPTTSAVEGKTSEAATGNRERKSAATSHASLTTEQQVKSTPGGSPKGSTSSLTSPRQSGSHTPQRQRRMDIDGRELPFLAQKSKFGVVTNRFECCMCQDLSVEARSSASQAPRSKLSRSPFEYRLASLQRWLRKRSAESEKDGLLASCLSLEAQRYLAYLGFADCWTSFFLTAGLPMVTSVAASHPSSPHKAPLRLPATLSGAASRIRSVPLSFYVLPALCRWTCVSPFRRDRILRESVMHPFPLPDVLLRGGRGTSPVQLPCGIETSEVQGATENLSRSLSSLTFFTIQQRLALPEGRRPSLRRHQTAFLGEMCACDVYLVAATVRGTGDGSESRDTVASVWGYVKREDAGSCTLSLPSSPSSVAQKCNGSPTRSTTHASSTKPPSGELFYIASSVENYLRLGLVFGWVYGWQMCFSSAGPPPNSVPWLRLVNSSAYKAALAASRHMVP
ncbi:hypothetical protein, conserved [Leishmania tarentolae]|uniref:Uncharacterized protein n=1 Tax=Leishmania tarentolae TaxID=5689 RepID=A0A640KN62_LEITA|nr:hypothetical protein, conserved [Leishmania tarentolae]